MDCDLIRFSSGDLRCQVNSVGVATVRNVADSFAQFPKLLKTFVDKIKSTKVYLRFRFARDLKIAAEFPFNCLFSTFYGADS